MKKMKDEEELEQLLEEMDDCINHIFINLFELSRRRYIAARMLGEDD